MLHLISHVASNHYHHHHTALHTLTVGAKSIKVPDKCEIKLEVKLFLSEQKFYIQQINETIQLLQRLLVFGGIVDRRMMMKKKMVNNNSSSCDTTATTSNTTGIMMMNESGIKGIRNDDNQDSMHERVVFNLKDLNNRHIFEKLQKIKSANIYSFQDIEKIHKWMMVSNSSNIHVQNKRGHGSSSSSGGCGESSRSDDMDRTHHFTSDSNISNNDSLFISKSFSTSQDNYQPSPNQQYHPHRNPHHQSHHSSNKNNHSSHHTAMTPNTNNSNTYSPIKIFNIYNNQSKHHYFNENNPLSNKMITHTNTSTTNTTTNGNDNYFDNFQITEKSYSPVLKRDLYITMNIFEPTSTSSLSSSSSKQIHNSDRMKNVIKSSSSSSSSRYADRNGDISIDSIYSNRGTDVYDGTNHHRNHGNDSKLINTTNVITKHLNNSHDSLQRHPHHQLRKDTNMITPINTRRPSNLLATDTSIISIIDSKNKATTTKAATTTTAILTNTTDATVYSLSTATIIKSAAIIATTPSYL